MGANQTGFPPYLRGPLEEEIGHVAPTHIFELHTLVPETCKLLPIQSLPECYKIGMKKQQSVDRETAYLERPDPFTR